MKILTPLTIASCIFISGCASSPPDSVDSQMLTVGQTSVHNYRCNSGEIMVASYPATNLVTVQYKEGHYNMQIATSGSGSRYVGGGLEWWTKGLGSGAEGSLFRHMADGTTGQSIEYCIEY